MPSIRPFRPSDTGRAAHICRATLPPSLNHSEAGTRLAPYLWTLQYTTLSPETCFVLDDGTGRAVGYVIGCPDVFAFAAAYPRYVDEVLTHGLGSSEVPVPEQLETRVPWLLPGSGGGGEQGVINEESLAQLAYNPRWLLLEGPEGKSELVETYRATMHIDLLPEWQGQGWGRRMIDMFVESVRRVAAQRGQDFGKGVHIGVSGENTKVVPFYERVGFKVYEGGKQEGSVWMVRDL